MNIQDAYNFKQVTNLLSCSGTLRGINLNSFSIEDYEVVINLLPDDIEYAVKDEQNFIENQGLRYEYIPVDWDNPKQSDFAIFEAILESCKEKKIHIHCAANYRVSAFYSIYAVKHLNWSLTDLEEFIAGIWNKSEYPVWEKFISSCIQDVS